MSQSAQNNGGTSDDEAARVVIKKYANRRLYNTETSSYITLDNLADMVHRGRDFVVYDARTGGDITRSVLTQIIVEAEARGSHLLPTAFLRQLIGFYGDALQSAVPRFLEQALAIFTRQQAQLRDAMKHTVGSLFPPGPEEAGRQNRAMIERAMNLFATFYPTDGPAPRAPGNAEAELAALRAEVETLRRELAEVRHAVASGHR
jgi:polyhydroxyalkanoate synthesis repressor PhaR